MQLWKVLWGFTDIKSFSLSFEGDISYVFCPELYCHSCFDNSWIYFFSKNKIMTKDISFIMFEVLSMSVPPTRQKLFQNFTPSCNASFKKYESTPPDFSISLHFLKKKNETRWHFGLFIIRRSGKNLMLYTSLVHYFCASLSFII